jgi:integrase
VGATSSASPIPGIGRTGWFECCRFEAPSFVILVRGHWRGAFNESVWKPALERAGLPHAYGFHSLRHTYASSLISQGLHPRVIQARLGHKSIVETMDTYGHLFPDANDETTRALDTHYAAQLQRPAREA